MKFILIMIASMSSISFATDKMSIFEMKLLIQPPLAGPNCSVLIEKLSIQPTCEDLRVLLQKCAMVAVDSKGQPTDVANVVECK